MEYVEKEDLKNKNQHGVFFEFKFMYDLMSKIKIKDQYDIIEKVTTKLKESIWSHEIYC
jgi:hypothetical protein